jgi:dTDP-4-amino-4,6-dideoxygalactose transaminase
MNAGEGGFLTTDDPEVMARAVIYSGSYMLYERHGAVPDAAVFADIRLDTPNYSGRMDNLRAALLRAQLPHLDENCRRWNARYQAAEAILHTIPGIALAQRPAAECYVGSSIQFRVPALTEQQIRQFLADCLARGVELKWFGSHDPQGFTSRYDSWRYLGAVSELPQTLAILATTFDMRIPLTFEVEDMVLIGEIIAEVLAGYDA